MNRRPTRTPSGDAVTQLILEIFPLHGQLSVAGDDMTAPWGLSSARWKVLGAIDHADRPLHVAQIARNMGLSRQAVQRIVVDLVKQGLLALNDNPDHRGAPLVSLTRNGERVLGDITDTQVLWSNALAEGMSPRTLESATRVIVTLCRRLQQHTRGD